MSAGKLDHRWHIQEKRTRKNSFGEGVVTWATVTKAWGSWEPLKGSERWSAQQSVETAVARIRLRYNPRLTARHRVYHPSLGQFEIVGEPEHYRREGKTVLHVSKVVE